MSHKNHGKKHHQHLHHWSFLATNFLLTYFQNSRELVMDPGQTELLQPKEELLAFAAASDRQGGRRSKKIKLLSSKRTLFHLLTQTKKISCVFFFFLYGYV
jgi:hypothetical protein